jgi:hypothetical protein
MLLSRRPMVLSFDDGSARAIAELFTSSSSTHGHFSFAFLVSLRLHHVSFFCIFIFDSAFFFSLSRILLSCRPNSIVFLHLHLPDCVVDEACSLAASGLRNVSTCRFREDKITVVKRQRVRKGRK